MLLVLHLLPTICKIINSVELPKCIYHLRVYCRVPIVIFLIAFVVLGEVMSIFTYNSYASYHGYTEILLCYSLTLGVFLLKSYCCFKHVLNSSLEFHKIVYILILKQMF